MKELGLPTAYCLLPTAYCRLPTADSLHPSPFTLHSVAGVGSLRSSDRTEGLQNVRWTFCPRGQLVARADLEIMGFIRNINAGVDSLRSSDPAVPRSKCKTHTSLRLVQFFCSLEVRKQASYFYPTKKPTIDGGFCIHW